MFCLLLLLILMFCEPRATHELQTRQLLYSTIYFDIACLIVVVVVVGIRDRSTTLNACKQTINLNGAIERWPSWPRVGSSQLVDTNRLTARWWWWWFWWFWWVSVSKFMCVKCNRRQLSRSSEACLNATRWPEKTYRVWSGVDYMFAGISILMVDSSNESLIMLISIRNCVSGTDIFIRVRQNAIDYILYNIKHTKRDWIVWNFFLSIRGRGQMRLDKCFSLRKNSQIIVSIL